jgi:hypothetical protein
VVELEQVRRRNHDQQAAPVVPTHQPGVSQQRHQDQRQHHCRAMARPGNIVPARRAQHEQRVPGERCEQEP